MSIDLTTKHLFDYVYLAEVSYANFNEVISKIGKHKDKATEQAISNPEDQNGRNKPESLAKLVTENYEVIAQYTDKDKRFSNPLDTWGKESGFSATLFRGKAEGSNPNQYVLAFKNTNKYPDLFAADVGELVTTGRC